MRYNTGNSVGADGSSSPFDLHDNSGNIDVWANDRSRLTWPDRLGVERKTFFGMEQQVTDFLIDMGYESVYLVYGTGIVVARQTQLVQRDGELYRVMNASDIPLTLTGTWATDAPKLQSVGDAALRQALSTDAGAYLSGYKGKTVGAVLDGLQVQVKLPTSTSDSSLDLAAALALSNNVVFPESTLPYVFKTQVAPILTKDTKIDFNGQLCQFNGGRLSLKAETVATGRTLNANAARYAFQISMGDTSGLQQGDILFINTSISPSTEWSDTKKDCVTVKGVTGNLVDLFEPLNFHYTTADSGLSITVYRAKELELINPNLLLIAADNDTTSKVMIDVYGMRGVEIRSPTIKGQRPFSRSTNIYRTGIQVLACIDTNITNAKSESMSYDDADLYFDNVDYRVPNRITKAPVAVRFGRNVSVCNSKMSDFWVSFAARDDVKTLIVGAGNRFGAAWSRTPKKDNILTTTRIDVDCPLDADLISGVYHINPREKMVPHSKGRLACRGAVDSNQSGAATFTASLRIHVNAFSDSDQANVILGKLKLFATVFHQNAGRFSTQEKHFNFEFDVQATSAVNAPLVATYTSGLSGQTNESVSIAIGAPSFAGVSQIGTSVDHYIEFPVTVSSGRTSPVYSLTYDLEMIRAA